MYSMPDDLSERDVQRWCAGGFVLYKDTAAMFVACIGNRCLVRTSSGLVEVPRAELYAHWPMCGSVNVPTGGYSLYVKRRQTRQWNRTFHPQQVHAYVIDPTWVQKKTGGVPASISDTQLAESTFFPEYYSLQEATKLLTAGVVTSVAICRALALSGAASEKRVYYHGQRVGILHSAVMVPDATTTARVSERVNNLLRKL